MSDIIKELQDLQKKADELGVKRSEVLKALGIKSSNPYGISIEAAIHDIEISDPEKGQSPTISGWGENRFKLYALLKIADSLERIAENLRNKTHG